MSLSARGLKRPHRKRRWGAALLAGCALVAVAGLLSCAGPAWGRTDRGGKSAQAKPTTTPVPACAATATNCGNAGLTTGAAALGTQAPTTTQALTTSQAGSGDLLGSLHGSDPFCSGAPGGGLTAAQSAACHVSGSVAEPYPISSYGIDVQSPSVTSSIGNWISYAFQSVAATIWEIALYAVRGVLLLLQWAYSLDLVGQGMSAVRHGLDILHNDVFGRTWVEAALAALGLWGIWNGLVRRRTIETLTGLGATLALMLGALVLIAQPQATVGKLSNYANQASLATLTGLSRGNVAQPAQTFASAEGDLFTALVMRPWCALEFGSVSYCTKRQDGTTVADVWLSSPANSAGRQDLYQLATSGSTAGSLGDRIGRILLGIGQAAGGNTAGAVQAATAMFPPSLCPNGASKCAAASLANADIKDHPATVQMQGTGGSTFDRLTLLAMVIGGLLGALCVLFYVAIKLLFASVKTLLLILAAPVMLLVAAFGESGRATCVSYGKSLAGAVITKLVFTVFLALVLLTASVINGLPIGWFSVWMLNLIFWWGIFFERRTLIQFLEMDKRVRDRGLDIAGRGAPFRVTGALIGGFAAWRAVRGLAHGAAALPRGGVRALQERTFDRRDAASGAQMQDVGQRLGDQAEKAIAIGDRDQLASSARVLEHNRHHLATRAQKQGDIKRLDAKITDLSGKAATASPPDKAKLEKMRQRLLGVRQERRDELGAVQAEMGAFEPQLLHARSAAARLGGADRVIGQREREAWVDQRRRDVAIGEFPDAAAEPERFRRALHAAGISHEDWLKADGATRADHLQRARLEEHEHRRHFEQLDSPRNAEGLPWPQQELAAGWRQIAEHPEVYERVTADARQRYGANRELRRVSRQRLGRVRSRRGGGIR